MDSRKYQLFKTELCRNWQEMGTCRYAKKCRFAHGQEELKCVQRHAKYKTEICKTFHLTGTCLYGVRCTFVHDEHVASLSSSSSSSPLFTPAHYPQPSTKVDFNFPLLLEDDFMSWKANPLVKPDSVNIWSSSNDRRYSSSSSSDSSYSLLPFII